MKPRQRKCDIQCWTAKEPNCNCICKGLNHSKLTNMKPTTLTNFRQAPCRLGLEPHDFQIEDLEDQVDERCTKCRALKK